MVNVIYNEPKSIIKEITEIVSNRYTNSTAETIKEIQITTEEKSKLMNELVSGWDCVSGLQCHTPAAPKYGSLGSWGCLEWNGIWKQDGLKIQIVVK